MRPAPLITTFGEVTDADGNNRLVLRFVERPLPESWPDQKAYDFHSLVWETRDGGAWTERVVITRADFQQGGPRRWGSELYSLDSAAGTAVIKVGEEQTPDAAGAVHVEYTWREWEMVGNRQVRVFGVCADPFEPFDGKGRGR